MTSKVAEIPQTIANQRVSERVVTVLTDRIKTGVYGQGDLLPAERLLAAELSVHRRSVRLAVDRLVREGLVTRRPNCRPTVGGSPRVKQSSLAVKPASSTGRISASNLIALIMWHGGGPLEHERTSQQRIFSGINAPLMKLGYHAVFLDLRQQMGTLDNALQPIGTEEENAAQEARHLRYILDQGFGGALFYPYAYRYNRELIEEVDRSLPMVLIDRKIPGYETDYVGLQNYQAVYDLTKYLIGKGHRRIAHVTRSEPIMSVQDRMQGYTDAIREENANEVMEIVLTVPPREDDEMTWTVIDAVFRLPAGQRPTAIICINDYMAVSITQRLLHLGLSVPEDVAVTGIDDIIPFLTNGVGLTTIAQPYEDIGIAAVDLLMRRINDRTSSPKSAELPGTLILRGSTGD